MKPSPETCARISATLTRHGGYIGRKPSGTYKSWKGMRQRCADKRERNYGERGIDVDPRWHDFAEFLRDMGERPPGMEIDRIDNSKGYSAANCRWVTHAENMNNRRTNVFIVIGAERMTIAQAARRHLIPETVLRDRLRRGWSIVRAVETPCKRR